MDTPTKSSIDDATGSATVETYDEFSIIRIPGIETLSESEQYTVLRAAERRLTSGALDAEALCSRLQSMTPPPDEEEDDEESRLLEADARKDLESDGCPACYPPHLDVPVRNPTDEYRPIIGYWQSFSSTGDVVLCAQRSDWRKFRASQQNVRDRYQHNLFSTFVDSVCERRRRHELGGHVQLLLDSQQQSRQQNWIEFQDYHLTHHERLEKKRDRLKKKLDDCQKKAGATEMEGSEHAAQNERAIQGRLEFAERTLRWHEVILGWIERQRVRMDPRPLTPVEEIDDRNTALKAVLRVSPHTSTVRGKVRVSKPTLKSRNMRTQTFKAPKSKPVVVDLGVTPPNRTQQMPKRQETKPPYAKEKPLGHRDTKSRPGIRCHSNKQTRTSAQPQRRLTPQRPRPASGAVKTRSGRISRPPVRWPAA
ncbi:hypothetical protein V8E54_011346 [Elaphomyces granulatus]